jgi:hypothetical protein
MPKPIAHIDKIKQQDARGASPNWSAIIPRAVDIITTEPEAKPLKPSMILMALASPATETAVNRTANGK